MHSRALLALPFSEVITYRQERSPQNNIFIGINHPLRDVVLEQHLETVHRCYAQTFWNLWPAWEACQAALAIAKRGVNVDLMYLLWGSGGVGLSLLTSHIAAMMGTDLHKYFDPNIFFQDVCVMSGHRRVFSAKESLT